MSKEIITEVLCGDAVIATEKLTEDEVIFLTAFRNANTDVKEIIKKILDV